jgi:AraC-like DNA-binding protein
MVRTFKLSNQFIRRMDEVGIPLATVWRRADLPGSWEDGHRPLLTTDQLFAFWQAIDDTCDDPTIGLALGAESRIERYDPAGLVAVYARSIGDAIGRIARYKRLTCPEDVTVGHEGNTCVVQFGWPLASQPEPAILIDCVFSWVLTIARRGTGERITPCRVEFRHVSPHRAIYHQHFGCDVLFGAARNALVLHATDLDRPFGTHNPDLLQLLTPPLDAELSRLVEIRSTRDHVKAALSRVLAGGRPTLNELAREMGLSTRTLQRRLAENGVNFQQILLETRRELARHYLSQPTLELNEAAYLLGFANPNSFFRAFHRWEGTSPGQWRTTQGVGYPVISSKV